MDHDPIDVRVQELAGPLPTFPQSVAQFLQIPFDPGWVNL